ncbi:MAG TPA: flavodoxin family protein [Desulfotomaculum sp.]|nr:flavodoxin family protein [Desulfotomaculum sp.]
MKLRFLALACSPRKNGNTAVLAGQALAAAESAGCSTELLHLADYRYAPCRACDGCFPTGRCVLQDDAGLIYEKILAADRLILAAPVFFMGICAQAKMLIDRAQQFWAAKYILKKEGIPGIKNRPARRGIFISCGGTTMPGVFDGSVQVVKAFFKMLEIELSATLCYAGVDKAGDILQKAGALEEVAETARKLCIP